MGADILAWAALYTSNGEKINIPKGTGYSQTPRDGYAYIGRYEGKPSYDIGLNFSVKDFTFMLSHRYGKQVPQYSWYGEVYDYDNYRHLQGNTIGYSIDETHLDLSYSKSLGRFNFNVSVYGDKYRFYDYAVVSDSIYNVIITEDNVPKVDENGNFVFKTFHHLYQDINWEEYTIGGIAKVDASYTLGAMKGNLLTGIHWENFTLHDNESLLGEDYDRFSTVIRESKNIINNGTEYSLSAFVQCKHYFQDNFILNAGLRFDNKHRKNDVNVTAFSPRVALIYIPSKALSTKLSYSRAFVDAPYFYRQNTSNPYRGSQDLMPEYIDALQLDFLGTFSKHFSYDINIFYNRLTDLICNNQSTDLNVAKYVNAGSLKIAGIEAELGYNTPSFHSRLNTTLHRAIEAEQYYYDKHNIYSIPSWVLNLSGEKRLLNKLKHSIWLSGNLRFTSRTLNKANSRIKGSEDFYLSGYTLLDLRLKYNYNNHIDFSLDCDNVFNTSYEIGGTSYFPYKYLGRNVMATVSFKL
jgi:iron complex outermembrane receptor protein